MHNGSINGLRRAANAAGIGWLVQINAPPPDYAQAVEPEFMKFHRLIVAGLTSLIASLPTGSLLQACERCQANNPCRTCTAADDHGLLDLLDAASHRLQPRLPARSMPRLPSLDTALKFALGKRSAATCGCEIVEANCGCELHEPTCGCEAPTGCGCQHHSDPDSVYSYEPYQSPQHQHQHQPGSTLSAPQHFAPQPESLPTPYVAPHAAPRGMRQGGSDDGGVPHINNYPPAALPHAPPQAPSRLPVPSPLPVPVPDSQIDPFRDDTATRVRQIPSRTIQYRQATPSYRQNYDPQASTGGAAHRRLSDDGAPAAQRIAFDAHSSSRSPASRAPATDKAQTSPAVITASGSSLRSYDQRHGHPTPLGPINPLRNN